MACAHVCARRPGVLGAGELLQAVCSELRGSCQAAHGLDEEGPRVPVGEGGRSCIFILEVSSGLGANPASLRR